MWYGAAGSDRDLGSRLGEARQREEERAVEDSGTEACLNRRSKTGRREDNRVRRAVLLSMGVVDGRGIQYTEGEGDGSIKKSNGGTWFKI